MEGDATRFMRLALSLAARAKGRTAPNPMVGAVVVQRGRLVGQGYHRRAGGPHAEVAALRQAGPRARGATLFVTLEPCNHVGRTPPCCEAVIRSGVKTVVVASRDPNPLTNGRGFARLRRAGLQVRSGLLKAEARQLNASFEKVMTHGLPFVTAKVGQSLDGKIATATGQSRWITSERSRQYAHALRRDVDAVLVGVNTVLRDDPRLSVRAMRPRAGHPVKVVLDSRLRTPIFARCLSARPAAPTLIATTTRAPRAKGRALERRGATLLWFRADRQGRVPLRPLLRALARRGVQSVLIEGGGEVLASAFGQRLVDRAVWCISPLLLGGREAPSSLGGAGIDRLTKAIRLEDVRVRRFGIDLCVEGCVRYPGTRQAKAA